MNNQYNYYSGLEYNGKNQISLCDSKIRNNFQSDAWLTFLQAKTLGLKIKKDSHGVAIFKGFIEVDKIDKDGKIKSESVPGGSAYVFNMDQTEEIQSLMSDEQTKDIPSEILTNK